MYLYFLFNIENIFISFIFAFIMKEKRSLLLLVEILFP